MLAGKVSLIVQFTRRKIGTSDASVEMELRNMIRNMKRRACLKQDRIRTMMCEAVTEAMQLGYFVDFSVTTGLGSWAKGVYQN